MNKQDTSELAVGKLCPPKSKIAANEAHILKSVQHPRIISLSEYYSSITCNTCDGNKQEFSMLMLENADNGEFFELITLLGGFSDLLAKSYFHQLFGAVEYLHNLHISHGDIKPENVLLDEDYNLKLCDFGLAQDHSDVSPLLSSAKGTRPYFLPEMHSGKAYNAFEADLFALGVTLFIMVTGSFPFSSASEDDKLYALIIEENLDEFWNIHEELLQDRTHGLRIAFKKEFKSLINSMLANESKNRLSVKEIKSHPWFKGTKLEGDKLSTFVKQIISKMGL